VRLFDRGDLNTYRDELQFLLAVTSCCRTAVLPVTLDRGDIDRYHSTYLSLLSDINQLITTVTSLSVDAVFRPATQSRLSGDLISLIRRYVGACWLRRVLISSNVAVDGMKRIQCSLLDTSLRWFWLREFVDVL